MERFDAWVARISLVSLAIILVLMAVSVIWGTVKAIRGEGVCEGKQEVRREL